MIKLKEIFVSGEKKKQLYFTVGTSGSGKSTYLKSHFNKNVIVSPDDIRRKLTGDVNNQSMNPVVWEQAYADLQTVLDTKGIAVLDGVNTNSYYRGVALDRFKDQNIEKIALVFNASPETSKERIHRAIDAGKDRADVPDEVIDRQYKELKMGYADLYKQFDKVKVVK